MGLAFCTDIFSPLRNLVYRKYPLTLHDVTRAAASFDKAPVVYRASFCLLRLLFPLVRRQLALDLPVAGLVDPPRPFHPAARLVDSGEPFPQLVEAHRGVPVGIATDVVAQKALLAVELVVRAAAAVDVSVEVPRSMAPCPASRPWGNGTGRSSARRS